MAGRGRAAEAGRGGAATADVADDHARVARFLEHLRVERGRSEHTIRAYGHTLQRLVASLGARSVSLAQVTRTDLRGFLFEVGRGRSGGTVARHMGAIRTFYRWMLVNGHVSVAVAEGLQSAKRGQRLPHVVPERKARELLDERAHAPLAQALLEVMYGAGLRVGEVSALDVGDIDLGAALVHVKRGKGGKERRVFNSMTAFSAIVCPAL